MTETAYRDVITRINGADAFDYPVLAVADIVAFQKRMADRFDEAARLAPPEVVEDWATMARVLRRMADALESGERPSVTREDIAAFMAATKAVRAHARENLGLELMPPAETPTPTGPPPPIPIEPAFDVPGGPVDEEEYARLTADADRVNVAGTDLEQDPNRLAEYFAAVAEVAPLDVRPAWAVMATLMQDALHRVREPSSGDLPLRVSVEQQIAAISIIAAAEKS
jgi:hypothetical protein